MLACDRHGQGPAVLLLHGTTSSRHVWAPLIEPLASAAGVEAIALDLPGHGDSPPSSFAPPGWALDVSRWLDEQGLEDVPVVGHSSGGWTALELAKLGRASGVLALAPAGLWRLRSPRLTNVSLRANWLLAHHVPRLAETALRSSAVRALALRHVCARPREVQFEEALRSARVAGANRSFPRHFAETRRLRFSGGGDIDCPVTVVWGERDRIALAGRSRHVEELPAHTTVETWPRCGHMLTWDAPDRVLAAIRAFVADTDMETGAPARARPPA